MDTSTFTLTTLAENPEYFEEVITLIEEEFHYTQENHFEHDFALLVDTLNFENCYLYIDRSKNKVIAHLAVSLRKMIKRNFHLKVALIGGIATHKDYRGLNLFTDLMNHALETHSGKCGLFILWSDLESLYEKFSFQLCGGFIQTGNASLDPLNAPAGFHKTNFKEISILDFETIKKLYTNFNQKYFFTLVREEKEWSIIREMYSIDLYIKRDDLGVIDQYFCANKGKDLQNIIHEVGCLPEKYLPLINEIQKFKTWLPESEISLTPHKDILFTAFMRIGNMDFLEKFLKDITNQNLEIIDYDSDTISLKFNQLLHRVSKKDFLQYFFGPHPLKEFEGFLLSPYIAGTDSI